MKFLCNWCDTGLEGEAVEAINSGLENTIHRAQPDSHKFAWTRMMFIQCYSLHLEMWFWPWDNSNQDLH